MTKPSYMDDGNAAELARLIKDGAIFVREYGISDIPTGTEWTPGNTASQIGYYGEDGYTLTPVPGDTTTFKGHNGDDLHEEQDPGHWTTQFAGLEGKQNLTEAYFDTEVDATDGSITVTSAAASKYYDIVTVGMDQNEDLILLHYPKVKISEREGIVFNRTTLLALGATFRTFKGGAAAPYHFRAWGLVKNFPPTP